ncbi:MAG: chemotaxis protein CheA, partial [Bdellovibrionia bacterium]
VAVPNEPEVKEPVPDDFFASLDQLAAEQSAAEPSVTPVIGTPDDDVTNHELLAELLSQLSPEEQAEFHAREEKVKKEKQPQKPGLALVVPEEVKAAEQKVSAVGAEQTATTKSSEPTKTSNQNSPPPAGGGNRAPTKQVASIKVDTARVDSVLDAVGELVVLKNQLVHDETVRGSGNLRLEAIVDQLDKSVRELYEKTLSIRMTPLKSLFIKIQRIVRDVSLNLDKPVNLVLQGEETEVERTVFELLNDPLVHLVRNAMDHGVEKKETRKEKGKPEVAKVVVSAKQSGGNVVIDIIDDGGGINREKVLAKAIERGFVPPGVDPASLTDEQVFQFIFKAGFSTADKISDLSGRGVGLDVVKSNLDKINGKINISSKLGVGTTFRMTIPLSTAITDGIVVSMEGSRYILPIHSIREIVRVLPKDYTTISDAGKIVSIRGVLMPVIEVEKVLGNIQWNLPDDSQFKKRSQGLNDDRRSEETMLVVLESMTGQMAMPVDDVLGQAQVVVKPISGGASIPEVAGAAILGDGKTVLILEPGAIVANFSKGQAA